MRRRKAFPEREGIISQQIKTSEAQLSNHDSICNFWLLLHMQSSIRLSLFNALNNAKIVETNLSRMLFLFMNYDLSNLKFITYLSWFNVNSLYLQNLHHNSFMSCWHMTPLHLPLFWLLSFHNFIIFNNKVIMYQ